MNLSRSRYHLPELLPSINNALIERIFFKSPKKGIYIGFPFLFPFLKMSVRQLNKIGKSDIIMVFRAHVGNEYLPLIMYRQEN